MAMVPVVGTSVGKGVAAWTFPHAAFPAEVRVANASPGLYILPKYGVPSPSPYPGTAKPVQPLPGTSGGGGIVGYPIDSG